MDGALDVFESETVDERLQKLEKQRNRVEKKITNMHERFKELESMVQNKLASIEHLERSIVKTNRRVDILLKNSEQTDTGAAIFPLATVDELKTINDDMAINPGKYINILRNVLGSAGIKRGLKLVFCDSLIMELNYRGLAGKAALVDFTHFNKILYESSKTEGYTYASYVSDVCSTFKLLKNNIYRKKSLKKNSA